MADREQLKLSDVVKSLHGRLRRQLREANGDHTLVWKNHCTDKESLEQYASAMHTLAVNHWTKQAPQGRVEWCYNTASEFFRGGGLKNQMEKQKRRLYFAREAKQCCCCFVPEDENKFSSQAQNTIYPSVDGRLQLLDVGSCFNPFSVYKDIDSIPIDLHPADPAVFRCDFLNAEVIVTAPLRRQVLSETSSSKGSSIYLSKEESALCGGHCVFNTENLSHESITSITDPYTPVNSRKSALSSQVFPELSNEGFIMENIFKVGHEVKMLPAAKFQVVVFSLLLSYFPAPIQRWECCLKAHRLLLNNGLLIIVTPDSSHQNRNAAMVKSWKTGIESVGFIRWKYVKQTHLHCMAFRKVAPCHFCNHSNGSPEMLYIPQDFQDEEEGPIETRQHIEENDVEIMECFNELPNIDESDDT